MLNALLIGVAVVGLLLLYLWPKIKDKLPTNKATDALDKVSLKARQAAATLAWEGLTQWFASTGDTSTAALLAPLYVKIWAYAEPTETPAAPPAPAAPTVVTLDPAQLAQLQANVAASIKGGTTS